MSFLVSQSFLNEVNFSGKHQRLGFVSPYRKQQLQALALQPAIWGISCLVLFPAAWFCSSNSLLFQNSFFWHCTGWTAVLYARPKSIIGTVNAN